MTHECCDSTDHAQPAIIFKPNRCRAARGGANMNNKPKPTSGAAAGKSPRRRVTPAQRPTVIYRRKPSPDFGHLVRALRQKAGLSQLAVAEAIGEWPSVYKEVEAGRRWPGGDPDQMDRLSRILRLSAETRDQLFRAAGLVPPELTQIFFQLDLIGICRRGAHAVFADTRHVPTHEKKYKVWGTGATGSSVPT